MSRQQIFATHTSPHRLSISASSRAPHAPDLLPRDGTGAPLLLQSGLSPSLSILPTASLPAKRTPFSLHRTQPPPSLLHLPSWTSATLRYLPPSRHHSLPPSVPASSLVPAFLPRPCRRCLRAGRCTSGGPAAALTSFPVRPGGPPPGADR